MYRMFRTVALSSALCLGLATASTLVAQDATPSQDQQDQSGQSMHRHGPMSPDQELNHMTKTLNLSSDQQSQIKPILQDRHDQMMQIHQDTSMSRQDKMAKMQSLDSDSNSKVEAVLNDQQKAKYEKMMAHRKEHMQHNRQMRQDGDQTSPSQGTGSDAQPQ